MCPKCGVKYIEALYPLLHSPSKSIIPTLKLWTFSPPSIPPHPFVPWFICFSLIPLSQSNDQNFFHLVFFSPFPSSMSWSLYPLFQINVIGFFCVLFSIMVAIYGFLFCFVFLCEWPLSWSFLSSHYTNSCFPCYLFLFNFHMISVSHHNFSLTLSNINLPQFRSCGRILFVCYISTIFDSNYENWPDFNHISIYLNLFLNASFYHVTCLV